MECDGNSMHFRLVGIIYYEEKKPISSNQGRGICEGYQGVSIRIQGEGSQERRGTGTCHGQAFTS